MPFGIGIWEMLILLLVLLLVFGPKRLPEMGRSLGKSMREFKDSISGDNDDDRDNTTTTTPIMPAELPPAQVVPVQPAPIQTPMPVQTPTPEPPEAQSGEPDRTS